MGRVRCDQCGNDFKTERGRDWHVANNCSAAMEQDGAHDLDTARLETPTIDDLQVASVFARLEAVEEMVESLAQELATTVTSIGELRDASHSASDQGSQAITGLIRDVEKLTSTVGSMNEAQKRIDTGSVISSRKLESLENRFTKLSDHVVAMNQVVWQLDPNRTGFDDTAFRIMREPDDEDLESARETLREALPIGERFLGRAHPGSVGTPAG